MSAFVVAIGVILLGLFAVMFIGTPFWAPHNHDDCEPRPVPYEPDAAMRAALISVRVPLPRIPLDDRITEVSE